MTGREHMAPEERPVTIGDVLQPYLTDQCTVALQGSHRLAAALDAGGDLRQADVPATLVHDIRVALRRLRSILRSFGSAFSVPEAGRLSDDAGWYARRLGPVRDLDVVQQRIAAAIADLEPDLVLDRADQELREQVRFRRGAALQDLQTAMHPQAYQDLLDQLRHWQHRPHWAAAADQPATEVRKPVKRAGRRLNRRLARAAAAIADSAPDADELIHAARKAGKRHRYAVEAAAVVLGPKAEKLIRSRRALQDQLGGYQDSVLTAEFLRDLGGIPGRNGFTFGVLHAREQEYRRRTRTAIAELAG